MKPRLLCIVLILQTIFQVAQSQNYSFGYDASGNRFNRTIPLKSASALAGQDSATSGPHDEMYNEKIGDLIISFYPNPIKDEVNLKLENLDLTLPSELIVYDNSGRVIKTVKNLLEYNTIGFSGLPPGNYIIKMLIGNAVSEWKIIKE